MSAVDVGVTMAAKAVPAPAVEHIEIWFRFQSLAERRIREGNILAGEPLWEIVKSQDVTAPLTIRSTRDTADFIECMLDLGARVLRCSPGSAIASGPLAFHLPGEASGRLRQDQEEWEGTLDQALALILDQLVWMEDGGVPESGAQ